MGRSWVDKNLELRAPVLFQHVIIICNKTQ